MPHLPHQKDWCSRRTLFKGTTLVMFADSAESPLSANPNIHISLNYTDLEEMKVAFNRLAEGGKITMPLENSFGCYLWTTGRSFGLH